ncbi:barstar family protein [Pseudomonas putida]|uniref:barstar family protein n=1 Tax=Pseudomonas putida TaxID=303 RepID=UPI0009C07FF1|nr:barstar family protein [Pseudomonas putida]
MSAMIVELDFSHITSALDFHKAASKVFGFPEFYGNNFHAFVDCLSSLRMPEDELTRLHLGEAEQLELRLINFNHADEELRHDFVEAIGNVNRRHIKLGEAPALHLVPC